MYIRVSIYIIIRDRRNITDELHRIKFVRKTNKHTSKLHNCTYFSSANVK